MCALDVLIAGSALAIGYHPSGRNESGTRRRGTWKTNGSSASMECWRVRIEAFASKLCSTDSSGVSNGALSFGRGSGAAPMQHVIAIYSKAEDVGGNKSELRGSNSDDADDGAVCSSNDPTLPFMPADHVGREQGKSARDVVKTKQSQQSPPTMRTSSCPSSVTIPNSV